MHELTTKTSFSQKYRKSLWGLLIALSFGTWQTAKAQGTTPVGKAWFPDSKFGIFIHWILDDTANHDTKRGHDMAAYTKISQAEAKKFTAAEYDPSAWAKRMKAAGAKYVVLTTKHHQGFALYDCPAATFNAKKNSPAKRDLVKPFADAMRKEGIKVGFYYSLPDRMAPEYHSLFYRDTNQLDWEKTKLDQWLKFRKRVFDEIKHLCTAYGTVDLFWFDGDWERYSQDWGSHEIMKIINQYQPNCVVNNRLRHKNLGDYGTPETTPPLEARKGWWEFCYPMGDNWNGKAATQNLKSVNGMATTHADMWSFGGTVLLNVYPDYAGKISESQFKRVDSLGTLHQLYGEAIFGTRAGLPFNLYKGNSTIKGKTLYLFVEGNHEATVFLRGITGKTQIEKIELLDGNKKVPFNEIHSFEPWGTRGYIEMKVPKGSLAWQPYRAVKVTFKDGPIEFNAGGGKKVVLE